MLKFLPSFILILLLTISCGSQDDKNKSGNLTSEDEKQVSDLVKRTDEILVDIKARRLFSSSTLEEKQIVSESMSYIKNSLLRIMNGEDVKSSFQVIHTYIKKLESVDLMFIDELKVADYKDDLYTFITKLSGKYGIKLEEVSWILYDYRFSSLWPFTTFSTAGDWMTDWSLGSSYVSVRGFGNRAWLISPSFDFSNVEEASLKLHHMLLIDGSSRSRIPLDRNKVIKEAFKVMVSEDYIGGHPEEATWEEYKLSGFPESVNFHATWSDDIRLEKLKGTDTTIALLYNMDDKILGRHRVTWQINKFQIIGKASEFEAKERKKKVFLYKEEFNRKNLGLNKSLSLGHDFPWTDFGRGGEVEFAKIEASAPGIDTWMLTPKISLKGVDPILKLKEVARNLDRKNSFYSIAEFIAWKCLT